MSLSKVRAATVVQKLALLDAMLAGVRGLPLTSAEAFASDPRDVAAADSYVRRALEALLDLGARAGQGARQGGS